LKTQKKKKKEVKTKEANIRLERKVRNFVIFIPTFVPIYPYKLMQQFIIGKMIKSE
jgi:hypothetical protein